MRHALASLCLLTACAAQAPGDGPAELPDQQQELLEIEVRVQAAQLKALQEQNAMLEARLAALEAHSKAPRVDPVLTDPQDGTLVPRLSAEQTEACARKLIEGIATAERAYDAAFDSFESDFERLGWAPSRTDGCIQHLAVWVDTVDNHRGRAMDFRVWAVILEGDARGKAFSLAADGGIKAEADRSEAELARLLTREHLLTRAPSATVGGGPQ